MITYNEFIKAVDTVKEYLESIQHIENAEIPDGVLPNELTVYAAFIKKGGSVRAINVLDVSCKRHFGKNMYEVLLKDFQRVLAYDVLRERNCGRKTIKEIEGIMMELGMPLRKG